MRNNNLFIIFTLLFLYSCKYADSPTGQSEIAGNGIVNESASKYIDSTLKSFVDEGKIAGVSALVFEKNKEVYFNAFGFSDLEAKIPMDRKTIVQIYSMTKPITGVALMTLFEKGKFKLDDPIDKYLPEFSNIKVYTGIDDQGTIKTEPSLRPITIRDLTRHTAGFANSPDIPGLSELVTKTDAMNRENTLTQMAEKMGRVPLWFHPGDQWEYGPCVDVQALLVERISGQSFDSYVREKVLNPLGMDETSYFVPENKRKRLAASYLRTEKDGINRIPDENALSYNTNDWPLKRGGSGLTSTLDDYMKFARMLVNDGSLDSTTILRSETVKLMATNQLSDSIKVRSWLPSKGQVGFGIDFAVRLRPPVTDEKFGVVGEFFWDGAASTLFWVDPVNKITAVMFVQLFPFDNIGLHKAFRQAVYKNLISVKE